MLVLVLLLLLLMLVLREKTVISSKNWLRLRIGDVGRGSSLGLGFLWRLLLLLLIAAAFNLLHIFLNSG